MSSVMTWNLENFERPAANAEQARQGPILGKAAADLGADHQHQAGSGTHGPPGTPSPPLPDRWSDYQGLFSVELGNALLPK
jgi:hypothetical protein